MVSSLTNTAPVAPAHSTEPDLADTPPATMLPIYETEPLVSIVIPVYNGTNYLRQAIDSALAQTYPRCEVLVINDGSTDGGATESIALAYGPRIRYIAKPNGGVASALNLGLERMAGSLLCWLSHDDVYLPEKVAVQVAFWQACGNDSTLIYSDADRLDAAGHRSPGKPGLVLTSENAFWNIWAQSWLNGCTMLIPKALLTACGNFRPDLPTTQDYDLWLRLARKVSFRYCPHVVVLSRVHAEQGSASPAHRLECARLFAAYVPDLLNQCAQHASERNRWRILAWCLLQRCADYGLPLLRWVAPQIWHALPRAALLRLGGHLLAGLPRALARFFWMRLPTAPKVLVSHHTALRWHDTDDPSAS